ncbi:MAG: DNA mismatch repair protein MutS [Firmicutes bacterium]|nr:DNA mismatch repair protein MutS [Bacillota bacterium]
MNEEKLSKTSRHYLELKSQFPDSLLVYRIGDFYEFFFEDAITASDILGLRLTRRGDAPMCGIPKHALEAYTVRLIKAGQKVAVCEQNICDSPVSAPNAEKKADKKIERNISRVFTAGTITEDSLLDGKSNNFLASVFICAKAVGISWVDISTGELYVCEFKEGGHITAITKAEDFLLKLSPSEIIAPKKICEALLSLDSVKLKQLTTPTEFDGAHFNICKAEENIRDFYSVHQVSALVGSNQSESIIPALSGLLAYISRTQMRTLSHISHPEVKNFSGVMDLDFLTIRSLEILKSLNESKVAGSLLSVLDLTKTNAGGRLIKKWISEPLTKRATIDYRLNAVHELFSNEKLAKNICFMLENIKDLERIASKISYGNLSVQDCASIQISLNEISGIKGELKNISNDYLRDIGFRLNPLPHIYALLDSAISDLDSDKTIKDGYSSELDFLRKEEQDLKIKIENFSIPNVKATAVKTKAHGYLIKASSSDSHKIPYGFTAVNSQGGFNFYSNSELKNLEILCENVSEKSARLEAEIFKSISDMLATEISTLKSNSMAIAELDILTAFAKASKANGYVMPILNESSANLEIISGRHPTVESANLKQKFIPNNAVFSDSANFFLITGPNMGGKSTYMRQNALIILMAHIGCFVPANLASIPLTDRIFTRAGSTDNLVGGISTFMAEMCEVSSILNSATKDSFIVLDEIGKSTSYEDGFSLAQAITEFIAKYIKAKTMFATHYHELARLESSVFGVKNLYAKVDGNSRFTYEILHGSSDKSLGIEVASLAGINEKIIIRAREIAQKLKRNG